MDERGGVWEGKVRLPDGYERFVKRIGAGPEVVVCLNGGPGADQSFFEPLTAMADERIQIVLYDQLDSGRSDWPEREELWTVGHFAREFEALVEALELGPVHLLGQSWGGILGLECALHCPQLLKSLVLCNTQASIASAVAGFEALIGASSAATQRAVAEDREFDPADSSAEGRGLLELYASHLRRCTPFDLDRSCREFVELVAPKLGHLGPTYYAMWGANEFTPTGSLRDWDARDRLGEILTPTLVIGGAHDEVVPECSREIVAGVADARWIILGQSSHMIFHESEAELAMAAIRGFVLRDGGEGGAR